MRSIVFSVIICCLAGSAARAEDAEKQEAKKHFEAGNRLRLLEDYKSAAAEYELSVRLYPTKNAIFNLANCYKALHRYGQSLETYERLFAEFGDQLDPAMRKAAQEDMAVLRSLVGELTVVVNLAGAAVSVDSQTVGTSPLPKPLILAPGEHEIRAEIAGSPPVQRKIVIAAGEKRAEAFTLQQAPSAAATAPPVAAVPAHGPPPAQPARVEPVQPVGQPPVPAPKSSPKPSVLFWIGLPSTIVVGATSAVFWVFASKRKSDFEGKKEAYVETDPANQTMEQWKEMDDAAGDAELFNRIAIGTTIGAGALAVGTALVLIFDLRQDEGPDTVQVSAAPGGIALSF